MKFQVDRRTWLRGEGSLRSSLLRIDGKQCCLGFRAEACGVSKSALLGVQVPSQLSGTVPDALLELADAYVKTPHLCSAGVTGANDDKGMSDSEREMILTELFAERGDVVEFIN